MQDLELKKQNIQKWVKLLGVGVAGFLFAPFAIATLGGIIGLGGVIIVGTIGVNMLPWFSVKVANWKLKALKHEAAKNPIETVENEYQKRQVALGQFKESVESYHGKLKSFEQKAEEFAERFPHRATQYTEQLEQMKSLGRAKVKAYNDAKKKLGEFHQKIEEKRAEWEMFLALNEMRDAASVGEDFQSKLMVDTAFRAVQDSLNTSFSELELILVEDEPARVSAPKQPAAALPAPQGNPMQARTLELNPETERI